MKKTAIRLVALLIMVSTIVGATAVTAFAANYDTNYSRYSAPGANDYAYWNGYRVVKASGTTVSEMKWMQASLNWCIANLGLQASYLDVDGSMGPASRNVVIAFQKAAGLTQDGSFGPSCISAMKDILKGKRALAWISGPDQVTIKAGSSTSVKLSFGGADVSNVAGTYGGTGVTCSAQVNRKGNCYTILSINTDSTFTSSGSVTFQILDNRGASVSKTISIIPESKYELCWPVSKGADNYKRITSSLGARNAPVAGATTNHKGIDIGVKNGSKVLATADGEVVFTGYNSARGNYVVIYHKAIGLTSVYQHLSSYCVKVGDNVSKGQKIALSGSTGNVSGPHLHFELILTSKKPTSVDCAWVSGAKLLDGDYNNTLIDYEFRK